MTAPADHQADDAAGARHLPRPRPWRRTRVAVTRHERPAATAAAVTRADSPWKPIGRPAAGRCAEPRRRRAPGPAAGLAHDRHEGDGDGDRRAGQATASPAEHGRGAGRQEPRPAPGGGTERTATGDRQRQAPERVGGVVARRVGGAEHGGAHAHTGHGARRTPPCASGGWRTAGAGGRRETWNRPIYATAPNRPSVTVGDRRARSVSTHPIPRTTAENVLAMMATSMVGDQLST